jgi:hypothetical protein
MSRIFTNYLLLCLLLSCGHDTAHKGSSPKSYSFLAIILDLIIRAGFPTQMEYGGIFLAMTAPAQ